MVPSFVMPENVLGVAMFVLVAFVLKFVPLGTWPQIVALVSTKCPTRSSSFGRGCCDPQGVGRSCDGPGRAASSGDRGDPYATAASRDLRDRVR
jgi:hypothetical protein